MGYRLFSTYSYGDWVIGKMAQLQAIQVIGMVFAVFMMYFTFLHYKRKEFTIKEYVFWVLFWLVFIAITLFPQVLDPVLVSLNIVRALDFFIIAGFLFLIFITVYTYSIVRRNQKKIEDVVREIAIKKAK